MKSIKSILGVILILTIIFFQAAVKNEESAALKKKEILKNIVKIQIENNSIDKNNNGKDTGIFYSEISGHDNEFNLVQAL